MVVTGLIVLIVVKLVRTPSAQQTSPQAAYPSATGASAPADHQISRGGVMLGKHSEEELRRLMASGRYLPTDFFWKPGMPGWAPLSSLAYQPTATPGQRVAIRGTVISFNIQGGRGLISGLNGLRYDFVSSDWGSTTVTPYIGLPVEFEANGKDAVHVFPANGHPVAAGSGEFYRSSDNVVLSGVCAGLAHKWNSDPLLIRIAMVFIPFGWIFYLIGSLSWTARPTRGTSP